VTARPPTTSGVEEAASKILRAGRSARMGVDAAAQQPEQVVAEASEHVVLADDRGDPLTELAEQPLAAAHAELRAALIEAIDAEEHQRERPTLSQGHRDVALEAALEVAVVEEPGRAIAQGGLVEAPLEVLLVIIAIREFEHARRPELDPVALEQRVAIDLHAADEGAVGRARVAEVEDVALLNDERVGA
jgi:hypothetical protein